MIKRPETFELSKIELTELTDFNSTMVEDYRQKADAINTLFDGLLTSADNVSVPLTATSKGIRGNTAVDSNFFYVCYALNLWARTPITAW